MTLFLKRYLTKPWCIVMLISFIALVTSFFMTTLGEADCARCLHQKLLWGSIFLISLMGLHHHRVSLIKICMGSSLILLTKAFKPTWMPHLFIKNKIVVSNIITSNGSFCKTPSLFGFTLDLWSFCGSLFVFLFLGFHLLKKDKRS